MRTSRGDPHTFGYGQVQFHAHVTLGAHPSLGMTRDKTEIVAVGSLCQTNGEDATRGPVWFGERDVESIRAFRAYCVIGQVKVGNRLGIVDRYWGLQEAIMEGMVDPEYEPEDGPNDWVI